MPTLELRPTHKVVAAYYDNLAKFARLGISFDQLAEQAQQPDADPFDLLCHLAFNAPLRTRRERAQRLRSERKDFFAQYSPPARQILDELLEKYAEHGDAQFVLPEVLRVPPISDHGQPGEIIQFFGAKTARFLLDWLDQTPSRKIQHEIHHTFGRIPFDSYKDDELLKDRVSLALHTH